MSAQGTSYHQKDTIMIRKISALLAAALVLGSASIASAATVTRHAKHHVEHGAVMLLENNGAGQAAAADERASENFQSNWNIGY
jgi:hypothetical protein